MSEKIPLSHNKRTSLVLSVPSIFAQLIMDEILDVITRDDGAQLEKILYAVKSKNTSHLDLRTKDYEKLYVFASFSGALNCLLVLSKLGE